jgi:hypothetical protein
LKIGKNIIIISCIKSSNKKIKIISRSMRFTNWKNIFINLGNQINCSTKEETMTFRENTIVINITVTNRRRNTNNYHFDSQQIYYAAFFYLSSSLILKWKLKKMENQFYENLKLFVWAKRLGIRIDNNFLYIFIFSPKFNQRQRILCPNLPDSICQDD